MLATYIPSMLHAPDSPMLLDKIPQLETRFNMQDLAKAEIGAGIVVTTGVICRMYRRPMGYSKTTIYAGAAVLLGMLYVWPSKLPVGAGGEATM